jgi:hypothetical protein
MRTRLPSILAIFAGLTLVAPVFGQGFDVSWWTIDGGGASSTGGAYIISGTAGQPDAGTLSGGGFTLSGGFWAGIKSIRRGDLNCDGAVDFKDINPFVLLLSNQPAWQAAYPGCPVENGDCDADGQVNFEDINPFVAILSGGG